MQGDPARHDGRQGPGAGTAPGPPGRVDPTADGSLDLVIAAAPFGVALLGGEGASPVLRRVNAQVAELVGIPASILTGSRLEVLLHPEDRDEVLGALAGLRQDPSGRRHLETRFLVGERRVARVALTAQVLGAPGEEQAFALFIEPVTPQGPPARRAGHVAMYDTLTGLPGRALLLDRLAQSLAAGSRRDVLVAVLALDLDDFGAVTQRYGRAVGDEMLVTTAQRLAARVRPSDTAARVGNDQFVVLVEDCSGHAQARAVAQRLVEDLGAPCRVDGVELRLAARVGIAVGGASGPRPEQLLRDAESAVAQAKAERSSRTVAFDDTLREQAGSRLRAEGELRRALAEGQLRVHYQPVVDLREDRVSGMEALLRWEHPTRGLLYPGDFLDLAEDSGLIVPIGAWVLREACAHAAAWPAAAGMRMAVNLSIRQLERGDFGRTLTETLAATRLHPSALQLEITESLFLEATSSVRADLAAIDAQGVALGIDDFGTGYSSLLYLKRFPVSFLKVDRFFVAGLDSDHEDAAIVAAVVRLGAALGLDTIAEGVETAAQLEALRALGCGYAQGYYLGRAQPPAPVARVLTLPPHTGDPGVATGSLPST